MMNIKRTLITVAVATMALVSIPTTVEAKTKEYKAEVKNNKYYELWADDAGTECKKGSITFDNGGYCGLSAKAGTTIYYNYKTNTTKVSSVKAPTTKSKKIKANRDKQFAITKNAVIKFKVVQGKVTSSKVKKAKTYYFVYKVRKADFVKTKPENKKVAYGYEKTIKFNYGSYDKVVINKNGKSETVRGYVLGTSTGFVYGPTTIQVTGYKMGKKLGTYTYNYDVKKYAPKEMHDYVLKGSLPNKKWCKLLTIPYGDGYAVSYTLDGSTPSLKNGKFMEKFEEDTYDWLWGPETGCFVERFNQYGKVTVKVQVYKKMYYKNTSNQYVFAGYEPVGDVQAKTYKTWAYNSASKDGYYDPAWETSINYMSYIAPTTQEMPHLTKMQVTYIDVYGYMVTTDLKPGEKLTDVHTKAQRLGAVVTFYVDGENVYEEIMPAMVKEFLEHDDLSMDKGYGIKPVTYQDYLDSFTDHPSKVCTGKPE